MQCSRHHGEPQALSNRTTASATTVTNAMTASTHLALRPSNAHSQARCSCSSSSPRAWSSAALSLALNSGSSGFFGATLSHRAWAATAAAVVPGEAGPCRLHRRPQLAGFLDDRAHGLVRCPRGVEFVEVTLHVGAGTFLPVKVEDVTTHRMHAEWGEVTEAAAARIATAKAQGRRVIPVGTTALRLIESAGVSGQIAPWRGPTDIFIYPGFPFQVADALMTNFHLPKSTLMMLVSALMGKDRIDRIYAHAISTGYRFFSYGDASLLIP